MRLTVAGEQSASKKARNARTRHRRTERYQRHVRAGRKNRRKPVRKENRVDRLCQTLHRLPYPLPNKARCRITRCVGGSTARLTPRLTRHSAGCSSDGAAQPASDRRVVRHSARRARDSLRAGRCRRVEPYAFVVGRPNRSNTKAGRGYRYIQTNQKSDGYADRLRRTFGVRAVSGLFPCWYRVFFVN